MLKDNQLTSILLLAVLGYFIYCLMKPKEGFAETASEEATAPKVAAQPELPVSQVDRPVAPEVTPEMVNQILAESEGKMGTGSASSGYQGNDEDTAPGADLDAAFNRPVPENVNTDVVDLNRNNVKNYNAKDFLPKELNDQWFDTDFSQAKYKMNDDKLINTEKYVVGVNTVGQSLKNASYDIRGAINVPKMVVSPWNNSTIEPDYNLKSLC